MKSILFATLTSVLLLQSCGPQAYIKGNYDENVEEENVLTDRWSETDMQMAVRDLVNSLKNHRAVARAQRPPILMVTRLKNETSEVFDTESISSMIKVELMRDGSVVFVDKAAREDIAEEYNYQNSGMVSEETRKGPGGQVGADFIVNGRIDSNVQDTGKDKTVYYKLTLVMTNLKTGAMTWTDHKQIRKRFRKKSVGL